MSINSLRAEYIKFFLQTFETNKFRFYSPYGAGALSPYKSKTR